MIVNINGVFVSSNKPQILVNDRGLLLGDGIFETLYYDGQYLECYEAHWQRLQKGLAIFQIPFHLSETMIHQQILDLLAANHLTQQTASVRITITRGTGDRGLNISENQSAMWIIQAATYKRVSSPLTLGVSTHCHPGKSTLSSIKHLGYQLSILGRLEARQKQIDDVVFVNLADEVVCSTAANIFAVIDGDIVTPPLTSGCLPGTKRGQMIQQLKKEMTVILRPILRQELLEKAETIFLTNSLIGIQSVEQLLLGKKKLTLFAK
jgi:branched-subunit amino acid aminotransferase/4-amino-4-deoxychorismate lyase